MIDRMVGWLTGGENWSMAHAAGVWIEVELALGAFLVEAANSDSHFDAPERAVIGKLLERRFALPPSEAGALLEAAEETAQRSAELFKFTHIIDQRPSPEERIEMLWEVAYADGELDQFEDSLVRRLGGLIYVPDRERGMARQRVLARCGLAEPRDTR
jgi:uncharacterized tellurite resistance protein B-like protein